MDLIEPLSITDAMLVSSSSAEDDYAAWDVGTAYVAGDRRIRTSTHKVYECLVGNTGFPPEDNLTGATPKWLEVSATNRWKMFDEGVGSSTEETSSIVVVLAPGRVSTSLCALELVGTAASVSIKDATGGTVVYTAEKALDATLIANWYDYFFAAFDQLTEWVVTDLPLYATAEITFTLTGSGTVSCGVLALGTHTDLGLVEVGASVSISDYSSKTTDTFGRTTFLQRGYSRKAEGRTQLPPYAFNRIYRLLARLRATPVIWRGTEEDEFGPLVLYGSYKDFSMVPEDDASYLSFQIEGLT